MMTSLLPWCISYRFVLIARNVRLATFWIPTQIAQVDQKMKVLLIGSVVQNHLVRHPVVALQACLAVKEPQGEPVQGRLAPRLR